MSPAFQLPNQTNLYGRLSWIWEFTSPPTDYEDEVAEFLRLIHQYIQRPAVTLLDLGCGTGNNDFWFKKNFSVTGVDLSEAMLKHACENNPEVKYQQGDIRTVRLGCTFDVVILADAADYMLSEEDLLATFITAFVHLNPGGVLITYAEETQEIFIQDKTNVSTHISEGVTITAIENFHDPDPFDTSYEASFVYLIRKNGKFQIETDRHLCGLFHTSTWLDLLEQAGFAPHLESYEGAGPSFIGVK